jgi:hypothetical protein
MKTMSLEYDDEMEELIEELKGTFGVRTKSAVIKKALALAGVARRKADPQRKTVTLSSGKADLEPETIPLSA